MGTRRWCGWSVVRRTELQSGPGFGPVRGGLAVVVMLAGTLLAGPAVAGSESGPESETDPTGTGSALSEDDRAARDEARRLARGLSLAFQDAAERIEPSVVHITTLREQQTIRRDLFGRLYRDRQVRSGLGSGVIVSEEGYILTNNHVVEGADRLIARTTDGRELEATLVGADALRDLAVLKVEPEGLTAATMGDSDALEVGQWVLAAGSPFGLSHTITAGIVSAKGRGVGLVSDELRDLEDLIQTDAPINPGNSGGPLIDLDGRVVGINTAIVTGGGGSVGVGFAIPSNIAQAVYRNLVRDGRVDLGWLGVGMQPLTPELARSFGYKGKGVLIADVIEGGPAAQAGLRSGDIVVRFGDRSVEDADRLSTLIRYTPPGSTVRIGVVRDGTPMTVRAEVSDQSTARREMLGGTRLGSVGMSVVTPDERMSEDMGLAGAFGALVIDVEPGSPAMRAGLRVGDHIVGLEQREVRNVETLERVLDRADWSRGIRLGVVRDGRRGYAVLRREPGAGRGSGGR